MANLTDSISSLHGIGARTAPLFERLGIKTLNDLVWHLPARYEDVRSVVPIQKLTPDIICSVRGTIQSLSVMRSFRRKLVITKATLADATGTLSLTWFGNRHIDSTLKEGDEIYIVGKPIQDLTGMHMKNPTYEKVKEHTEQLHAASIVPFYELTLGITQKQIRFLLARALKDMQSINDDMPAEIQIKENFLPLAEALRAVHFPLDPQELTEAIRRIKFEELFWTQLKAGYSKKIYEHKPAPEIKFKADEIKRYINSLPFELTGDQKKSAWSILQDLEKNKPANRLLQGDVGSGKTVVASIAMVSSAINGFQSLLMAPTELLAMQHYKELLKLFKKTEITLGLLTGKLAEYNGATIQPSLLLEKLATGIITALVGTHSLIQDRVTVPQLGVVIIDEQHRFGVSQRQKLTLMTENQLSPHLVSLSATPIPRTLALTLYGNLDISTIHEKPKGRKEIVTRLIPESKRSEAYEFIRKKALANEQTFVLCPRIEETEASAAKSAVAEGERLQKNVFPELEVRVVHGKMKAQEKQKILEDFKHGLFPILVATSVIEVGIDIPGATIMVIENAERFGLAQLHQLRGRVGRNDKQSHCLLFTGGANHETFKRLRLLTQTQDGFKLAEEDLKMRGAGEVFGTRQSGIMNFKAATIHDTELIKKSTKWVERILSPDGIDLYRTVHHKLENAELVHFE